MKGPHVTAVGNFAQEPSFLLLGAIVPMSSTFSREISSHAYRSAGPASVHCHSRMYIVKASPTRPVPPHTSAASSQTYSFALSCGRFESPSRELQRSTLCVETICLPSPCSVLAVDVHALVLPHTLHNRDAYRLPDLRRCDTRLHCCFCRHLVQARQGCKCIWCQGVPQSCILVSCFQLILSLSLGSEVLPTGSWGLLEHACRCDVYHT